MRIGFMAGYPQIGEKVKQIAESMGIEVIYRVYTDYTPGLLLAMAKQMIEEQGCQALLVRNPLNYFFDEHKLSVPVQCLELASIDIVKALRSVDEDKTIAFFGDKKDTDRYHNYQTELSHLSNRRVIFISGITGTEEEQKEYVREKLSKADVVATSSFPLARMMKGKEVVYIGANRFQIINALENLSNVLQLWEKEQEYNQLLQIMLESTDRSYVAIRAGRVVLASARLYQLARTTQEEAESMTGDEFFRRLPYYKAMQDIQFKGVFTYQDTEFLLSQQAMSIGNDSLTIYTFQFVSKIQKEEYKVRELMLKRGFGARYRLENIKSNSPLMEERKRMAAQFAKSKNNVLITGESGTGKEMFAHGIHSESLFAGGPFVVVNCAALPENLLESELFGYEGGAFTGAKRSGKAGYFELSHNGTLFLDEIGELPLALQGKLLRALQEKVIFRVGGEQPIPIRNRIICATNRDLFQMVNEGTFREDLFYRINVLSLNIPPLRERVDDIPILSRALLQDIYKEEEKFIFVHNTCLEALKAYQWPGNVRQLRSFLQRVVAVCDTDFDINIFRQLFEQERRLVSSPERAETIEGTNQMVLEYDSLEKLEQQIVQKTIAHCGGSVSAAASVLDVSRTTIWRKIKFSK